MEVETEKEKKGVGKTVKSKGTGGKGERKTKELMEGTRNPYLRKNFLTLGPSP